MHSGSSEEHEVIVNKNTSKGRRVHEEIKINEKERE